MNTLRIEAVCLTEDGAAGVKLSLGEHYVLLSPDEADQLSAMTLTVAAHARATSEAVMAQGEAAIALLRNPSQGRA